MAPTDPTRRRVLAAGATGLAGLLAGCGGDGGGTTSTVPDPSPTADDPPTPTDATATSTATRTSTPIDDWRTAELTDVLTDEPFSVAGLSDPVVLETFAVWCPACTEQQSAMAELRDDDLALVSLNTDPNEDAARVRRHAEDHGFDWRYAVAPAEYTRALVAEFGSAVTVAPRTPVVVVCEDGTATFLENVGVEPPDRIRAAAADC